MKIRPGLNKEEIVNLLHENREFLIPVAVIATAVFLFLFIIVPQLISFPSKKSDRSIEIAKLNKIKEAKEILSGVDNSKLDAEIAIVSQALPSEKNFEVVLNAISTAANLSSSQIAGYQYTERAETAIISANKFPYLAFAINVAGDPTQAVNFVNELYKTYPLSEVISIKYEEGVSVVSANFYYKPFTSVGGDDAVLPRALSAEESKALTEISGWNETGSTPSFDFPQESTGSAGRTSPF